MLVRLLTSRRVAGEMEESKFYRFCRMQNLCVAVEKDQLPDGAHGIIPIFNKSYYGHNHGTLQDEMGHREPQKPRPKGKRSPSEKTVLNFIEAWLQKMGEYPGIHPPKVTAILQEDRFGQRFEPQANGNNHILFTESQDTSLRVGTISEIFLHH